MADFTWDPDNRIGEDIKFKTLVSSFENGVEQRRNKWANPLRTFRLSFRSRDGVTYAAVRDFFITKKGSYSSFTWTNPADSVTYNVRFTDDGLNLIRVKYDVYDFDITFQEVR